MTMNKKVVALLLCVWCGFAAGQSRAAEVPTVHVTLDIGKTIGAAKTPRTIFGTFLEPIGNSTYNGLWAEVLENPSFEDNLWSASSVAQMIKERPTLARSSELGLPLPWEPLDAKQGARYAPRWNDAANSYRSLFIAGLPDVEVGMRQRVYLPVHRVLRYSGSVYLKSLQANTAVEVSLRSRDDRTKVFARQSITPDGNDWRKYNFEFAVPANGIAPLAPADFVISLPNGGRVLVDQVSLIPADNISGMDPEMIKLSQEMKTPLVRFGGNFTSAYNWRDGVGPQDKRVSMLNLAWGMPEYNTFGTDEFLQYCKLIHARPQIALNLGTGTPEEAAEWVRYVNQHWNGGAGGLLWEMGNELWGDFQTAYPAESEIAARTKAVSDAVRSVDPKAQLIATGADPDHFAKWNALQMSLPAGTFDYLSTHFVVTDNAMTDKNATPEKAALAAFALPVELERKVKDMHAQFQADAKWRSKLNTAFTEWLFWSNTDSYVNFRNMGGALGTGGFMNMLLRNSDIVPISDMTGIVEFAGIWKKRGRVFAAPSYYAFSMYSNADVDHAVQVESDAPSYDVERGIDRFPEIRGVPHVDCAAAANQTGDKLTAFCVNRSTSTDYPVEFRFNGVRARAVAAKSVYADSVYATNDENEPQQVVPRAVSARMDGAAGRMVLRHESVTVVEFTVR